jgi:hypothetical protein
MPQNNLNKNFKNFEKSIDKMFIDILKDISIKYNINMIDLKKYYPNNFIDFYDNLILEKKK